MTIDEIFNSPKERVVPIGFNQQTVSSDCYVNHNKAKILISVEWMDITDYDWAHENSKLYHTGMRLKIQGMKQIEIFCDADFKEQEKVMVDIPNIKIFYASIYGVKPNYYCVPITINL